jgi:hypothetical protein
MGPRGCSGCKTNVRTILPVDRSATQLGTPSVRPIGADSAEISGKDELVRDLCQSDLLGLQTKWASSAIGARTACVCSISLSQRGLPTQEIWPAAQNRRTQVEKLGDPRRPRSQC